VTGLRDDAGLDDVARDWGVESVVAALDHDASTRPPRGLRAAVLGRAQPRPPCADEMLDPVEIYHRRVVILRGLLDSLGPYDWDRRATPYDWTVHRLVAHMLVIERYTAARLGLDTPDVDGELGHGDDHQSVGSETIRRELERDPEVTATAWAVAARRVADHVRSDAYRPAAPTVLHGWSFSQSSALVARSFELWTHTDDVRRAIGRAPERTAPAELRAMSSFSVRGLFYLVQLQHPNAQVVPVRIVLTGAGGGTYDIGGPGAPVALAALGVVEYCLLMARRLDLASVSVLYEGDRSVAQMLLRAGPMFSV
jgi:uncharacterized protein (TIGR03083 family)